jgi:hypothetical protein
VGVKNKVKKKMNCDGRIWGLPTRFEKVGQEYLLFAGLSVRSAGSGKGPAKISAPLYK